MSAYAEPIRPHVYACTRVRPLRCASVAPPLLRRASQLHGSYAAIEGGRVDLALMDLTAGAGECIKVAPDAPDVNDGSLWKRVLRLREEGNLMGAGSPAGSDDNVSAQGIVQGHAYALLAVLEVDGFQLVQLRNPWGDTEWKGAWSDGSREWTPRIMTKVKYVDADDGTFYMEFSDFVHHFEHVYVCRVFDESWLVTTCDAAWAGETAGGCNNTAKIANNPQASQRSSPRRRRRSSVESSRHHIITSSHHHSRVL